MSLVKCICGHAFDDTRLCRREKLAMWCCLSANVFVVILQATPSNDAHISCHVSYYCTLGQILANPACSELYLHTSLPCLGETTLVSVPTNFAASSFLRVWENLSTPTPKYKRREQRNQYFDAAIVPITWCYSVSPEMEIDQIALVLLGGSLGECAGNNDSVNIALQSYSQDEGG